ncbi:MAG: TIGR01906 family membrane protein [Christensenellales bacterium]|jgi:integral membrane protein (TIGR01906 family)
MQRFATVLCTAACALFVICALLTCVEYACFDRGFYEQEYRKLDTARTIGMKHSALVTVTNHLLDYTEGKAEKLSIKAEIQGKKVNVFDERDTAHMADVRSLFLAARSLRNWLIPAILLLAAAAFFLVPKDRAGLFARSCVIGFLISGVVVGAVAVWAAVDFNAFWTAFHKLLFTNDLWLLNPAKSVLIKMVPSQFFFDLVMRIVGLLGIVMGIPLFASAIYLLIRRIRRHSLMTIIEE